jgi:class 3 adenylate cyclase
MMQERERLNRDAVEPLRIGIGIATGIVVAGCIGTENRSDYTVVGEKVNLAARLCSTQRQARSSWMQRRRRKRVR